MSLKDYLTFENARNKRNAGLYERMIKLALGSGVKVAVLVGHHLTFEIDGDLATENEIPSADCLIFDHEFMGKIFGGAAISVMQRLASLPVERRDAELAIYLDAYEHVGEQDVLRV